MVVELQLSIRKTNTQRKRLPETSNTHQHQPPVDTMFRFLTNPLILCAALAVLARGDGDWSKTCSSVSMTLGELQANCNTPPMGPPWICSELVLNHCYAFNAKDGIHAKDEYVLSPLSFPSPCSHRKEAPSLSMPRVCEFRLWLTDWLHSGNFGDKCEGCDIDSDGHTMRCQCTDSGKTESYYVNTGEYLRLALPAFPVLRDSRERNRESRLWTLTLE